MEAGDEGVQGGKIGMSEDMELGNMPNYLIIFICNM